MPENTDEEPLDNSTNNQSENPPDEIIPTIDTKSITQYQESENMEELHHPNLHHKPQKWKAYFLEFLMIFLAVTLGFFAENFRENRSERETEKHTIESLVKCLASDTIQLNNAININKESIIHLDIFSKMKNVDMSNEDAKRQFLIESFKGFTSDAFFRTNDGALEQLKSSGMFRLVHKQSIIDSILLYDLINKSTMNQEVDFNYVSKESITLLRQVVNCSFFRDTALFRYTFTNKGMDPEFKNIHDIVINRDREKLNNFYSIAAFLAGTEDFYVDNLKNQLRYGKSLIEFLKKEYNIE